MKKYIRANQDIDTSLLSLEMMWRGINDKRLIDQIGMLAPDSYLEVINGQTINYCIDQSVADPFFNRCANLILNENNLLPLLKNKTISITNDMQQYAREILPSTNSLNEQEIAQVLEKILFYQSESGLYGAVIAFADFHGEVTNKLIEIVSKRKNLSHPIHVYTTILGTPDEQSLTQQAYDAIRKGQKNNQELLNEYFWLDQGYIGRGLTEQELKKIKNSNSSEDLIAPSALESELQLTEEEKTIFAKSKDIVFTKSLRADVRQFLYVIANQLVDRLAKQWQTEPKYIEALYADELIDILTNKQPFPNNIEDRYKHSVYISGNRNTYEIVIGNDAKEFIDRHFATEKLDDNDTLKGQVAYPGQVQGRAKLVFGPQHNNKVKDGDILISSATSPQLLPAMKNAAAFVTDMGGITSHAAIVARELKKTCLVGTKYATQLFQDGDLVEVDAHKGTVKKV